MLLSHWGWSLSLREDRWDERCRQGQFAHEGWRSESRPLEHETVLCVEEQRADEHSSSGWR